MRLRSQSYHNLLGHPETATSIRWYWRLLAVAASVMILGGFLMLPITFNTDVNIRVSNLGLGIFAVAILLAGLCATILACIIVRDRSFQATEIFRPALISCVLGFLTVFYNFMISRGYVWNIPAILTAAVAGAGAVAYAFLLFRTTRKTSAASIVSRSIAPSISISRHDSSPGVDEPTRYQSAQYYQNYIKNMFPSAAYEPAATPTAEQQSITEEEMQRQQMLMLLLKQDQAPNAGSSSSTFRIEWQGQEQEHDTPVNGYFAPGNTMNSSSSYSQTQYGSVPSSVSMRVPGGLMPWDGVWRGVAPQPTSARPGTREDRRREIELGA